MAERTRSSSTAETRNAPRWLPVTLGLLAVSGLAVAFPPFRVVPWTASGTSGSNALQQQRIIDVRAAAEKFWSESLERVIAQATPAGELHEALEGDPAAAAKRYARVVGIGGVAYYFVAGEGRVSAVENGFVYLALGENDKPFAAVPTGPIFGNAVRDGTGSFDVNASPSSADFNALSAELNRLVEERVQPALRGLDVGSRVRFAGSAEITSVEGDPRPLQLVPVWIEEVQ